MIRVKGTGLQKEAEALAEKIRLENQERLDRQKRLGPVRKAALWVTLQWWFSQLSLTLIVVFSVMLGFYDPTDPDNETPGNQFISKVEKMFIVIFTLEVLVVWLAEGLCRYFDEPWNTLDFIIVGVGYLSLTPVGANLGALRTIRLLRPLRSLKRIASMRRLVNSMLAALPGLVNVGTMIFAFIFVTSLFGVKMFKGIMKFGCVPTDSYDAEMQRALMMADAECEKCMPRCTAATAAQSNNAILCTQITGAALSNATACGQVVDAGGNRICVYRAPRAPSWGALPFHDLMISEYDADTEATKRTGDAVLDEAEQSELYTVEGLEKKSDFWQCAICQPHATQRGMDIPIRQRYGGRPLSPDSIGYRSESELGSCAVAEKLFGSDVLNGTAVAGSIRVTNAKSICLGAGNCQFTGGTDGMAATCKPHTFRVQYLQHLTAAQLVKYLGVPQKIEEIDLRAYGLDQYEPVCNGFLGEDEEAAGYDTSCDQDEKLEPGFAALLRNGVEANRCQVQPRDCPCDCQEGYTCVEDGGPNYGISSFDNMGQAILTVFQIMTLEGWTEILDRLTDMSSDMLVIVYFIVIVWGGAFFLTHYMLAMICLEFTKKMKGTVEAHKTIAKDAQEPESVFENSEAPWGRMYRACIKVCAPDPAKTKAAKVKKLEAFVWWSASYRQLDKMQREQAAIYLDLPDPGADDAATRAQVKWPPQPISESQRWPEWSELKPEQQEAATKLGMLENSWPPKNPGAVRKFRLLLIKVTSLPLFDTFINTMIIVNFSMLAADRHELDESVVETFESVNGVLTNIFAAEMIIKQFGYGLGSYFADKFNCFDCFIVITSLLEKMMDGGGSFSVLRTLRLLRILRSLKMMSGLDKLKAMIETTAGSIGAIANFAVLLLLLLYIFALVGMQMFGGKLEIEGETARPHFDNLIWSFTSVFLVMTRENWQALLYDTMHATGPAAMIYYYALIISTSYILLALFVGTLLENFENFFLQGAREQKEKKDRIIGRKTLRNLFRKGKQATPLVDEDVSDFASKWKKKSLPKATVAGNSSMAAFGIGTPNKYVANAGLGDGKAPEEAEADQAKPPTCNTLIGPIRRIRTLARGFVENKWFETAVIVSILASSGCLAYEHPLDSPGSVKTSVLEVLDLIFIIFFTFEMAVKILAVGLFRGKESYLRSGWNILDGFIVSTSLIVLLTDIEGGFFRIIRTVRVLRPLRAIQRSKGMRAVAGGLFKAVPSILTVAMLVFFFMLVCAIFCVQLFKGTMYMCTNPTCASPNDVGACDGSEYNSESVDAGEGQNCPIWSCTGTYIDPESGSLMESEWVNSQWNFDNVPNALLALFEIFALEAWPDILLALVDATDACHGPMKDSQVGVVWLFVVMIMFGAFFLLNLFVGVIVTAYNELQSEEEETEDAKTARHDKRWHDDIVELASYAQPQKLVYLDYRYRGPFMRITNARQFEAFVMLLIVLNVCVMGVDWVDDNGQTPPELVSVVEVINLVFTYSFAAEMVIKLISYYPRAYFGDPWNVFDFIITMISLVEALFKGVVPLNPTVIRIFRIFRLARLLRLSKKAKGLKTLMKTFSATLPSLGHVGFLLMIFFFMYAVLGVQLFWNLQRQELVNDYTNFDDFGNAIYSLFRLSTGENWNGVMHECMIAEPDCAPAYCQLQSSKVEEGIEWDGSKKACERRGGTFVFSDCGSGASAFYHITFIIICAFTTLNLIIAVILFAFFDFSESDKKPTLGGDKIQTFEDAWARFDKNAEGELEASLIPKLLMANGIPLGAKKFDEAETLEHQLWDSNLLFDYNGRIKFTELLHAMIKVEFGVDCLAALTAKAEAKRRKHESELEGAPGHPPTQAGQMDASNNEEAAMGERIDPPVAEP